MRDDNDDWDDETKPGNDDALAAWVSCGFTHDDESDDYTSLLPPSERWREYDNHRLYEEELRRYRK